ncbi:MAG TPA: hypothetical protein VMU56_04520 [Beijerinckiaceae bacterium]|nr:hypothetical protein [Beijerinckiaceae bacterium]
MRQILIALGTFAFLITGATAATHPIMIRGKIVTVKGDDLSIKTRGGKTVELKLAEGYSVGTVKKASLSDIKPNSYIGTAALPQPGGVLKALEVNIFPASQRGVGEGSRAWNLAPHSRMTNAPVTGMVKGAKGDVLTLTYKGGEKKVLVSPGTPIVMDEPGAKSDMKPGVGILAFAAVKTADGSYKAKRIIVGKNGVNPPQ